MGEMGRSHPYQCKMRWAGSVNEFGSAHSLSLSLSLFVVGAAESSWTIFVVSGEVVADACVRSSVVLGEVKVYNQVNIVSILKLLLEVNNRLWNLGRKD